MTNNLEINMDNVYFIKNNKNNSNNNKHQSEHNNHDVEKENVERDLWTNKTEYMLSVIGYVVDLGSGAFLVPYFTFLIFVGVPMMYMEMAIAQYFRVGNITLWGNVNHYMKGIGYASLLVVCYITFYYATLIAYSIFYLVASFQIDMPWSSCNHTWNTVNCKLSSSNLTSLQNETRTSPAEEYFNRRMLGIHKSSGINDLGDIKLDITICLVAVYVLLFVCICNGIKSTGKAVYVTAVLPYVILVFLLVHGLTLKGSKTGLYYFLVPVYTKLFDYQCWKDAAIQVFFTLGPGISVLTTYSSYSKFNNNCQWDAIVASIANVIASFLSGIVVFSSLGYLSVQVNKKIEDVVSSGLGLSFIAYPELLSTLNYPQFFSIIFFLMIFTLGLDSCFGGIEAVWTALADELNIIKKNRVVSLAIVHFLLFLGSLPTVTYGGNYMVVFLDTFSTSPALMIVVLAEAITVCYLYGIDTFKHNIHEMFSIKLSFFWILCWKYIGPLVIFTLFIMSIIFFEAPTIGVYSFPDWVLAIGWLMNISIIIPIPLFVVIRYLQLRKQNK